MGYMVFAEHGVPKHIDDYARKQLPGVSGVAVSAEYLAGRLDVAGFKRNPFALPEVEDLSPIIDTCGVSTLDGKSIDDMRVVTRDDAGEESPAGDDFMQYDIDGETAELPMADFLRKTSVRFVPMVKDFQRRRLFVEDLQGDTDGITWAFSFDDVNERFRPCPRKSDD
jgi:hypothetical protein